MPKTCVAGTDCGIWANGTCSGNVDCGTNCGTGTCSSPTNGFCVGSPQFTFKWYNWSAQGTGLDNNVYALATYNGKLIAGGWFTAAGGKSVNYTAAWNGTDWSSLGSGIGTDGSTGHVVNALTVYNGQLIVAGVFDKAGGKNALRIAAWNGTGWNPLGAGINYDVNALTVYNGQLIAGGQFSSAGGVIVNNIAAWDGTSWHALGSGINSFSVPIVYSLAVYNNKLIAGGTFSSAGGVNANNIASWNGTAWSALGSGTDGTIYTLTNYSGQLIVGGQFWSAGGTAANSIASWDGSSWHSMGSITSGIVYALRAYNGSLIVGKWGSSYDNIEVWDGGSWRVLDGGVNHRVTSLGEYNNDLIAGGNFINSGSGINSAYIIRGHMTGSVPSLSPFAAFGGFIKETFAGSTESAALTENKNSERDKQLIIALLVGLIAVILLIIVKIRENNRHKRLRKVKKHRR